MGVQVHRHLETLTQRGHQCLGRRRAQQPGHVFDRQNMRPGLDHPFGQPQVVVQGVEVLVRIGEVAGVAQGGLSHRSTGSPDCCDGRDDLIDVIERIEDPKDVHPGGRGLGDKGVGDLQRVGGVADRVAPTQQHLQRNIGHLLTQQRQPLPRVLLQKPQGDVVRSPTPDLRREQTRHRMGHRRGRGQQVTGTHPGGQQRLVSITERGVSDPQCLLLTQSLREGLRALLKQQIPPPGRLRLRRRTVEGTAIRLIMLIPREARQLIARVQALHPGTMRLIHRHISQILQGLGPPVLGPVDLGQLRVCINEICRYVSGQELLGVQHVHQKRNIGGHTTNAELRQRATSPGHRSHVVMAAAGELHQHRIEMRTDLRTGVHRATVQPDTRTTSGTISSDRTHIRAEPIGRILSGDPALHRRATDTQLILDQTQILQGLSGGNTDLRAHQIHVRDLFSDRMLHLNPGIHLDEHMLTSTLTGSLQQKFHRARIAVAHRLSEGDRVAVQRLTHLIIEIRRRSNLDHLLVPALQRTIPLKEVDHITGTISEHLDLNMARPHHRLLQKDRRIAERRISLVHRLAQRTGQSIRGLYPAHPAAASTSNSLHKDRKTDPLSLSKQLFRVSGGLRALQHRHTSLPGRTQSTHLIASGLQHISLRADESNTRLLGRTCQIRILREEPIPGINRIRTRLTSDPDDLPNIQIGPHRVTLHTNPVRLISLLPVQRIAVLMRIHRHRTSTKLNRRPQRTNSNLTTIGNKDLAEHYRCSPSSGRWGPHH